MIKQPLPGFPIRQHFLNELSHRIYIYNYNKINTLMGLRLGSQLLHLLNLLLPQRFICRLPLIEQILIVLFTD